MKPTPRRMTHNTVRLRPEQLEDRAVPAVYTVLGTADEALPGTVTQTGSGTFNASSLRAAVLAANQSPADDTIVLGAGTYTLTVDGSNEDGGATGDLDVRDVSLAGKLTVTGAGQGATTITQAFSAGLQDRLFDSQGGDLTLNNLTLTGGNASYGYGGNSYGGAVRVEQGSLTLTNVTASGNTAYLGGGAIFVRNFSYGFLFGLNGEAGGLRISNSVISNNTVTGSYGSGGTGGGVAFFSAGGTFEMTDSVVSGNTVLSGGEGGGLSIASYAIANATIARSVISGNAVLGGVNDDSRGGGVYSRTYSYGAATGGLTVVDTTVSGNRAVGGARDNNSSQDGRGGGIFARGSLTVLRSTVSANTAEGGGNTSTDGSASAGRGFGGGIFVSGGEGFSLVNSTVSGNQALGGSITGSNAGGGTLFAGNALGGGVFLGYSGGFASVANSTIAANSAVAGGATTTGTETLVAGSALGGGIVGGEGANGVVTLSSTLVATNTVTNAQNPAQAVGPDVFSNFISLGNNLIGIGDGATGFTNGTGGDLVGTAAAPIDPLIGPLADNGGPTQTHALLAGSPALNAGSNLTGLTSDQRGIDFYRTFGGGTDIGAFEVQTAYVPVIGVGNVNGLAQLRVLNGDGTVKFADLNPFPGFGGSVYTATADFNGDRIDDIVAGAGVGGGPVVKVYDGATGAEIASFYAFTAFSRGGVSVATGDVNGDGTPDVIVGAGVGGGPRVIAIDGTKLNQTVTIDAEQYIADSALLASFFAFDANWRGGITVAFADGQYVLGRGGFSVDLVNGVFVPTGPGIAAEVAIADLTGKVLKTIQVFDNSFIGGVNVAAGGGVIAAAPAVGGGPRVQLYDKDGNQFDDFPAFDPALTGGASVGILGFGTNLSLLVGAGPGGGPQVNVYTLEGEFLNAFPGLDPAFTGGVFVG